MLQAALSQVETRALAMTAVDTYPVNIPGLNSVFVSFAVTVPENEQWVVITGGERVTVDSAELQATAASIEVLLPSGILLVIPTQAVDLPSLLFLQAGLSLQGVELPPRSVLKIGINVQNVGAGAHDVTAGECGILVRPIRLTSEIALAQLVNQQVDQNLARRLAAVR